ncbi:hypothetical protein BU15DRAFT_53671 [Melanogaster broomeanus]|nr:hypothetical protein BU15DRAFT_53671 [Melanogaster broomeanus]
MDACVAWCGKGQEPFDWSLFSQQFAAWLLPYLALVSQLPFGARSMLDNFLSALLTVGSPTLAGYSLILNLLDARWLNDRFRRTHYPTRSLRNTVVRVLGSLQQVPLRVHPGDAAFFESLIILPENDKWWSTFYESLHHTHTWSIASATSIIWVVVAYLLTVADSLSNVADHINASGQGTGSVWLWLLPVVVGWLVLAPTCDYALINHAYNRANECIVIAGTPRNPTKPSPGLEVDPKGDDLSSPDEARTPPVFYYSRALSWSHTVYIISLFYDTAWSRAQENRPVNTEFLWKTVDNDDVHADNRRGSREQVVGYCRPRQDLDKIRWAPGVFSRMILASLVALATQWGTTGAAVITEWFTPTTTLGCRSLAYLIYGAVATVAWFLFVLSSLLAYYARPEFGSRRYKQPALFISHFLRWVGVSLAAVNAVGIVTVSVFQYANVFDRCYCNSNALTKGWNAVEIIIPLPADISEAFSGWVGGFALASLSSLFFVGFIYLLVDSLPSQ